jgi:hypothetical protein
MWIRKLILFLLLLAAAAAAQKTVHVRTYTRNDGTVVRAHDRAAPGVKSTPSPKSSPSASAAPRRTANGRMVRSATAKREFQVAHPYPATGKTSGPGRNFVVDHVIPIACGGADAPSNMQWQTVAAAKEKDRWERRGCAVR